MNGRLIAVIGGMMATACGAGTPATAGSGVSGCSRQQAQCEAACQPRELPGSTEKGPVERGDLEAERCLQRCDTIACQGP